MAGTGSAGSGVGSGVQRSNLSAIILAPLMKIAWGLSPGLFYAEELFLCPLYRELSKGPALAPEGVVVVQGDGVVFGVKGYELALAQALDIAVAV